MSEQLLQEYLSLVIEKIRSKKGPAGKFEMSEFRSMRNRTHMLAYADERLDRLGSGSSRRAFTLSGKYVLKIALNEKGVAQNETELDVYTNPKSKPIVAKIYAVEEDNQWIIADIVKPVNSAETFQNMAGVSWQEFGQMVDKGLHRGGPTDSMPPFVKAVVVTARENNLLPGDIASRTGSVEKIDSWGQTPDGRLVLLDYGFSEDVWHKHYKSTSGPQLKSSGSAETSDAVTRAKNNDEKGTRKTRKPPADVNTVKTMKTKRA